MAANERPPADEQGRPITLPGAPAPEGTEDASAPVAHSSAPPGNGATAGAESTGDTPPRKRRDTLRGLPVVPVGVIPVGSATGPQQRLEEHRWLQEGSRLQEQAEGEVDDHPWADSEPFEQPSSQRWLWIGGGVGGVFVLLALILFAAGKSSHGAGATDAGATPALAAPPAKPPPAEAPPAEPPPAIDAAVVAAPNAVVATPLVLPPDAAVPPAAPPDAAPPPRVVKRVEPEPERKRTHVSRPEPEPRDKQHEKRKPKKKGRGKNDLLRPKF